MTDLSRSLQPGKLPGDMLQRFISTYRTPPDPRVIVNASYGFDAAAISLLVAIPIGILSAVKQYSKFDHIVTTLTFVGQSIPSFFLGLLLLLVFYMRLDNPFTGAPLLPSGGVETIGANYTGWEMIKDRLLHLILPVTMLSATWVAWYSRFLRASMLENRGDLVARGSSNTGWDISAVPVDGALMSGAPGCAARHI